MLWGSRFAGHQESNTFYSDLAKVARWFPSELLTVYHRYPHSEVMQQWAMASGATHLRTRHAVSRVVARVIDAELSKHPNPKRLFAPLDPSMGTFALQLAIDAEQDGDRQKRLALYLFASLARIAAYENVPGLVRWRSSWLRGKKNARAIWGSSTFSGAITRILQAHVLERVKGHWAGGNGEEAKAATYRLRIPIVRGEVTPADFARTLGLEFRRGAARLIAPSKL